MKRTSGRAFGVSLLMLMLIILVAGCTQSSSVPASTATPAATASPLVTAEATTVPAAAVAARPDNETLKAGMVTLAGTLAKKIDKTNFTAALKEGENSTAFAAALGQLKDFKAADSRIAYVYTLEQKNGTVSFLIDDDYGNANAARFREEYVDAPAEMKTPVTEAKSVGPYTDKWGTFISAFAPVDLGSNTTVILVIDSRV
ncbi:MAG: hypothetical protein LUQ71_03845 [Methanoregula sp.]|nr:hypothetical protein [Methanoregula sp.]